MKQKAIIVSGYFNPVHKGHVELFHNAKQFGEHLIVIVNNDYQRVLKGSKEFMSEKERLLIINELHVTDTVILSVDTDLTVCRTIEKIHAEYSDTYSIYFANGGDQNNESIPESSICSQLGIELIEGLGDKIQSSSWLLNKRK